MKKLLEIHHTVADDLFLENCHHGLKLKGLETSERSPNPKIKLDSGSHGIGLEFIKLYWLTSGAQNMASDGLVELFSDINAKPTYARSVLLNLALLTSIEALPAFACLRTSAPMCSPSRSQSVQINRARLYLAWFRMFSAMGNLSCKDVSEQVKSSLGFNPTLSTSSLTGASNSDPGGQDCQPLYWRSKSRPVR